MTDRRKVLLYIAALAVLLILFFSKILFTDKIVRAPDIINEFYWGVEKIPEMKFTDQFRINIKSADWDIFSNGGMTTGGGAKSTQFLLYKNLIFYFFQPPASVAWFMVFHLFFGAAGAYLYCRAVGASPFASLLGGLIFAVAPENASLINAGHVMKIATISFVPWAFYFFEKGFQTRKLIFFLATAFTLAFQFFNTHWQVAYYTCLCIGVYALLRGAGILINEWRTAGKGEISKLIGMNLVTMIFFLSTVAISLLPLAHWSTETTRGAKSGAGGGKGGISVQEGMLWSLPPEELSTFIIPGLIGLSRQEGGENPTNIRSYYWGRMIMTQTTDYMGLLPWLLLPLPLIFRRDRYTWIALFAVVGGIIFSMGKYSFIYRFLFDYFPGINRFRVPKMMMFIPVFGVGILAARGLDILIEEGLKKSKSFKIYMAGILSLPLLLLLLLGIEVALKSTWINLFYDFLRQPTRYEYGAYLIEQRWDNLVIETGIAAIIASIFAIVFFAFSKRWLTGRLLPYVLLALFLCDVWRINDKFMFLIDLPQRVRKGNTTPVIDYLKKESKQYRVMLLSGVDSRLYETNGIPMLYTPYPVQQKRWEYFLDSFNPASSMPDFLNLRYLVYDMNTYEQEKGFLGSKYKPVFQDPNSGEIVLENQNVLPKGWLVSSVFVSKSAQEIVGILQNPSFNPNDAAIVESIPPIPMPPPDRLQNDISGEVIIDKYEAEFLSMTANVNKNSMLVLGEKYYDGWKAFVDGKPAEIYRANYVLRGVYLTPGVHKIEFVFDPLPYKIGKYLTLFSFALFAVMLGREVWKKRKTKS